MKTFEKEAKAKGKRSRKDKGQQWKWNVERERERSIYKWSKWKENYVMWLVDEMMNHTKKSKWVV